MDNITKVFEMVDDNLVVTVTAEDDIILPNEKGDKESIGKFKQITTQNIDNEKIQRLRTFIAAELDKGKEQLKLITGKLDQLKDITDIDAELIAEMQDKIGKGTKQFKQKMLVLNDHISKVADKQRLSQQSEFISKEVERLTKELSDLDSVL